MNDHKPILAIETSDILCGASVYFSDEYYFSATSVLKNSHSDKLFSLIEHVLKESQIKPEDLDSVAISEGPGSFTGLRIGMSAAKGIAMGLELPVIPVPTFEAFACQIATFLEDGQQFAISNKVNKDEVFYAKFQVTGNNYIFAENLTILNNAHFIEKCKNIRTFGNAIRILTEEKRFIQFSPAPEFVARWAKQFGMEKRTSDYDYLEPSYLKNFIGKEKKQ